MRPLLFSWLVVLDVLVVLVVLDVLVVLVVLVQSLMSNVQCLTSKKGLTFSVAKPRQAERSVAVAEQKGSATL